MTKNNNLSAKNRTTKEEAKKSVKISLANSRLRESFFISFAIEDCNVIFLYPLRMYLFYHILDMILLNLWFIFKRKVSLIRLKNAFSTVLQTALKFFSFFRNTRNWSNKRRMSDCDWRHLVVEINNHNSCSIYIFTAEKTLLQQKNKF